MRYIGLDVGTTGIKAAVLDISGNIYARAYRANELIVPGKNMAELNGEDVWQKVKEVLSEVTQKSDAQIDAISISTFGEAFLLLDSEENILCNSMLFIDWRGSEEIKDITQEFCPRDIFLETGMTINPMFTLNKLLWVKKHWPEIFKKAAYIMNYEDYIIYKLTGKRIVSYSLASRTMYYNLHEYNWSHKILDAFGIDRRMLSTPVASGTIAGKVKFDIAKELSLDENLIVVTGGHDQACATLGMNVMRVGDCFDGMGTNECIAVMIDAEKLTDKDLEIMLQNNFVIEPSAIKNRFITLAYNPGASSVLDWYIHLFKKECDSVKADDKFHKAMDSECPEEVSGILVLPHFSGSGTPYCDANSTGAIVGISLNTQKSDILKAIYESMCFEIEINVKLLEKVGILVNEYNCTGGLSKSEYLLQLKADISGKPVYKSSIADGGTYGLALLCAYAMGEISSFEEGYMHMNQEKFLPDINKHQLYKEKFKHYKRLYPKLKSVFK